MINNKLEKMFKLQKELQSKLNVYSKMQMPSDIQEYINQNFIAIIAESVEMLKETRYKDKKLMKFGWKNQNTTDLLKFKEEIIDIIHFILNLAILVEMTPDEMYNLYVNKNLINLKRKEINY